MCQICEPPLWGKVPGTHFRENFNIASFLKKQEAPKNGERDRKDSNLLWHRRFQPSKCQKTHASVKMQSSRAENALGGSPPLLLRRIQM